ncbi:MAG TPA: hypothetical protein VF219_05785 [Vicinamibacterales bacterium]
MANVVGGVVIVMVGVLVPLGVAWAALSVIMTLMAFRDGEPKPDRLEFRSAETPAADPASAR